MKYLTKNASFKINNYNFDKLLFLLVDRPNLVGYNNVIWLNVSGYYHRDYDLPAVVWANNNNVNWEIFFYQDGKFLNMKF